MASSIAKFNLFFAWPVTRSLRLPTSQSNKPKTLRDGACSGALPEKRSAMNCCSQRLYLSQFPPRIATPGRPMLEKMKIPPHSFARGFASAAPGTPVHGPGRRLFGLGRRFIAELPSSVCSAATASEMNDCGKM